MKTTEEMIAVMQAHADGQPIQFKLRREGSWGEASTPSWAWGVLDYRVKPVEPKKVMMQMWRHPTLGYVAYSDGFDLDLRMQSVSEKIGEPYEFLYPEGE